MYNFKANKYTFKKNNFKKLAGFSLVETMMAILILTITIMAPLTLSLQTIKYSRIATDKMQATYMAEESIEMIYNLKKSAEIYCVDGPISVCKNYFNDYFLAFNNIIPSSCIGLKNSTEKNYCNFDFSNMINFPDKTLKLKNLNPLKVYVEKVSSGLSIASETKTSFKRSVNITLIDKNEDSNTNRVNSILVTSIVCVSEKGVCDENSQSKVILQNLISR